MSAIENWLADLQRTPAPNGNERDDWLPFRHTCTTRALSADDLANVLRELGPVSGWITETGRVVQLEQQFIELVHRPLAGEFFRESDHWQLNAHPRGRWLLHHHELSACSPAEATHLGEKVEHLMAAPKRGWLEYRRLWAPGVDPDTHHDLGPVCRIALLTAIRMDR